MYSMYLREVCMPWLLILVSHISSVIFTFTMEIIKTGNIIQ